MPFRRGIEENWKNKIQHEDSTHNLSLKCKDTTTLPFMPHVNIFTTPALKKMFLNQTLNKEENGANFEKLTIFYLIELT